MSGRIAWIRPGQKNSHPIGPPYLVQMSELSGVHQTQPICGADFGPPGRVRHFGPARRDPTKSRPYPHRDQTLAICLSPLHFQFASPRSAPTPSSPVISGMASGGSESALFGSIDWELAACSDEEEIAIWFVLRQSREDTRAPPPELPCHGSTAPAVIQRWHRVHRQLAARVRSITASGTRWVKVPARWRERLRDIQTLGPCPHDVGPGVRGQWQKCARPWMRGMRQLWWHVRHRGTACPP